LILKETFYQEFPSFKEKINTFIVSSHFHSRLQEYEETIESMSSPNSADTNEDNELHTELLDTIHTASGLMQEIVSLYQGIDTVFKMDRQTLGLWCDYDFAQIDKRVTHA